MTFKKLLIITTTLALVSCAAGPDYTAPDTSAQSGKWAGKANESTINQQWWKIFKDPLLEQYIAKAAAENKDVKIAVANLRAARASRREEAGAFFPAVSGSGSGDRSKSNDSIDNLFDAGFDASWEIDIFGANRRAFEAASARSESALAAYQGVMLATLSEVARNYYEARGLQKRIAITKENTELLKKTLNLIEERFEAGEASEFDVSRARGEYQLTHARLPNLQADLQASLYSLSVLLGQPPEALLAEMQKVKPLPAPPDIVPVGIRSDILRRRPDVREAERELAAATADIGVETAELFPKFFLTGFGGGRADTFGDVFSAAAGAWSLGAFMDWSIFEGGAIRARIEGAKANEQAAFAQYEKTVLEALKDSETALIRYGQELETRKRLNEGVQSRRKSVKLAQELFDSGEEDFLAVIDAERELTASEDSLVVSETQSVTKLIALYAALGGGWEEFPPKD